MAIEQENLGEIHFTGHRFPGADDHFPESGAAFGGHFLAATIFDNKGQPLHPRIPVKGQFLTGVVGDTDGGDDGFTGEILVLIEPESRRELGVRHAGQRDEKDAETPETDHAGQVAPSQDLVNLMKLITGGMRGRGTRCFSGFTGLLRDEVGGI